MTTSDQVKPAKKQHTKPCGDCPWRKTAIKGWLGGVTKEQWIYDAHSDDKIICHCTGNTECAGVAIYRKNVAKSPRDKSVLILPADKENVFATPMEFLEYHTFAVSGKAAQE